MLAAMFSGRYRLDKVSISLYAIRKDSNFLLLHSNDHRTTKGITLLTGEENLSVTSSIGSGSLSTISLSFFTSLPFTRSLPRCACGCSIGLIQYVQHTRGISVPVGGGAVLAAEGGPILSALEPREAPNRAHARNPQEGTSHTIMLL